MSEQKAEKRIEFYARKVAEYFFLPARRKDRRYHRLLSYKKAMNDQLEGVRV